MVSGCHSDDADSCRAVSENLVFLSEYRREGLRSSLYAAYVALGLLMLFILIQELSNIFTSEALIIRILMICVLLLGIFAIIRCEKFAIQYYSLVVGGVCGLLFTGVVVILYHPEIRAVGAGFGSMPAVMFGLFLMYGFLRLPTAFAMLIGCGFSVLAVWAAGPEYTGAGKLRLLMYLCAVNILGAILSSSIERRERRLFDQRYLLEEARRDSDERARVAEKAYSEKLRMIAAVNHDLRQPMIAATAHLGLLRRRIEVADYPDALQQVQRIDDSIGFLGETLDHLLTAARYESGAEPVCIEYFDLQALINQVHSAYSDEATRKGLEIRLSFPNVRVEILSDRASLSRILMNLVGNALKFNRQPSSSGFGVLIRVQFSNNQCIIYIADTGIGIDLADQDRIWDPYVQLDRGSEGKRLGLGLGLFVVNAALLRLSGHSIRMRSRVGRGTRFSISAPGRVICEDGNASFVVGSLSDGDLKRLSGAYVVILIENHEARKFISNVLSNWGVVTSEASSIRELLLIEASSDRVIDAFIVGMLSGGDADMLEAIKSVRKFAGRDVVSAVVGFERSETWFARQCVDGIFPLAFPVSSVDLCQIILGGVDENRILEGNS
jgi:signal transduction histidine kinase